MNKPKNLLPKPKCGTPYTFVIVDCIEGISHVGNPKIDLYCDIAEGECKGYFANNPKVRTLPMLTAKGNITEYGQKFIDVVEQMNDFTVDWDYKPFANQFIGLYFGGEAE